MKESCTESVIEKRKITNINKYGHVAPCQNTDIKQKLKDKLNNRTQEEKDKTNSKREETLIKEYGVTNINHINSILEKSKNTRIEKGLQIPDKNLSDFKIYRKKVTSFTNKIKKELFNEWNGIDFYDGEHIKENLLLNKTNINYPTIDHKVSVLYGFINNIKPEIIGGIDNLCITKLTNNCKKSSNNFLYQNKCVFLYAKEI